jgi:hypothetical protein
MTSDDHFLAEVAATLERARNRVTRVTDVTDEVADSGIAEKCRDVPPVSCDADAAGGYTVTQATRLHRHGDCEDDALLERAAIMEHDGGLPREIADGLATLDQMEAPPGFPTERWADTVAAMATFANEFGVQAIELGWTAEDFFGLNPYSPSSRYDGRGLASLLTVHDRVVMLTADAAVIERPSGSRTTFRRQVDGRQACPRGSWIPQPNATCAAAPAREAIGVKVERDGFGLGSKSVRSLPKAA